MECKIKRLSTSFYQRYPHGIYPEIMRKEERPYTCLTIDLQKDYIICIPFRSNIQHDKAFIFNNTARSATHRSGLDYKKTVLIKDKTFIDDLNNAVVDNDEYIQVMQNVNIIISEIDKYITKYIDHVSEKSVLHQREFIREYKYSTLPYFHDILDLQ